MKPCEVLRLKLQTLSATECSAPFIVGALSVKLAALVHEGGESLTAEQIRAGLTDLAKNASVMIDEMRHLVGEGKAPQAALAALVAEKRRRSATHSTTRALTRAIEEMQSPCMSAREAEFALGLLVREVLLFNRQLQVEIAACGEPACA